jgi:hypothetical protein
MGAALAGVALPFVAGGAVVAGVVVAGGSALYDTVKERQWDSLADTYPSANSVEREQIRRQMLATDEGRRALAARPRFGGVVLSAVDPKSLENTDLKATFGQEVLAEALLATIRKKQPGTGETLNRDIHHDPALFRCLAEQGTKIDSDVWNDKVTTIGARKRGLGPRVCQALWNSGEYDLICKLIEHGVDTSLAAPADPFQTGSGVYSGFVQPIQHVISKHLRDVAALEDGSIPLQDRNKAPATGAKKILDTLNSPRSKQKPVICACSVFPAGRWTHARGGVWPLLCSPSGAR